MAAYSIVTESVFSMDGDRAPLRELVGLKKRFGAMLLLDEAHAIGVVGANGRGLAHELELTRHVDVQMGTLSKALGVSGGYICGSRSLIEWLVNRARSFIFSTAPPPALAAAAMAAIEFLESSAGEERRLLLWRNIETLRAALAEQAPGSNGHDSAPEPAKPKMRNVLRQFLAGGLMGDGGLNETAVATTPTESGSAIHPILIGDEEAALDFSHSLQNEGLLAPAIRYPTVARGAARLRITVTAAHEESQIRTLAGALARHRPETINLTHSA